MNYYVDVRKTSFNILPVPVAPRQRFTLWRTKIGGEYHMIECSSLIGTKILDKIWNQLTPHNALCQEVYIV